MICGHCGASHERATEVRACYEMSNRPPSRPTTAGSTKTGPTPSNTKSKSKRKKKPPPLSPVWNNPPKGGLPQPTVKAKKVVRPNEAAPKSRSERAAEAKKATPGFDKRDKYD